MLDSLESGVRCYTACYTKVYIVGENARICPEVDTICVAYRPAPT